MTDTETVHVLTDPVMLPAPQNTGVTATCEPDAAGSFAFALTIPVTEVIDGDAGDEGMHLQPGETAGLALDDAGPTDRQYQDWAIHQDHADDAPQNEE